MRSTLSQDFTRPDVTLDRPEAPRPASSGFPSDFIEQARGRVRLLAGFFVVAFAFDLLVFLAALLYYKLHHQALPAEVAQSRGFQWINLGAVLTSAGLWWSARSPRVSASLLHSIGLAYEVAICFISATLTFWQFFLATGIFPNLTWVPAIVIMFPLILPGPPRRTLVAAIAAALTSPLALFLLDLSGKVDVADGSAYVPATVGPAFAVGFAYLGARVIYGLGREVATARAMGSYQLEEKLGEGGMGEVWRARHRLLARPAAVKLIRFDAAQDAGGRVSVRARERFEREAQAIAGLRSPHTVNLFDFGVASDGSFYYAMELLDGLDADALVRRYGPVPAERAICLLRQVCHSLSEAESRGLVHRDIKPANIFLCRYGEDFDFVKVLDFGIVKSQGQAPGLTNALTREHVIHGTPAFMAPEQALGSVELDGRADLYALGCVAFWLLTGKLLFAAETPTAMLLKHIQSPPTAPSSHSSFPIPPALDAIVLSCLDKDPARRPQTARELSRRLEDVAVEQSWTETRCKEWWETHRPTRPEVAA